MYTEEEYILFSILYSKTTEGRFNNPVIDHDALYALYEDSLIKEVNLFAVDDSIRTALIKETTDRMKEERPRINKEKKAEKLKRFFKEDALNELKREVVDEYSQMKKHHIKGLCRESEKYPAFLKDDTIIFPPFVLYYKGNFPSEEQFKKSLAIIGTRSPDPKYGKVVAEKAGRTVAENGWYNLSGLALGCDEYGHKGSIVSTGAILGHGLGCSIYPKQNQTLAEKMLENKGCLISELPAKCQLKPIFLTLRDRLQSGLTRGIFVVETPISSGTMHTVKYALEQNKVVMVWNPLEKIQDRKEVSGNMWLIYKEKENKKSNVAIKKEELSKVICVNNSEELLSILKNLQNDFR